jgi:hypothetical protein
MAFEYLGRMVDAPEVEWTFDPSFPVASLRVAGMTPARWRTWYASEKKNADDPGYFGCLESAFLKQPLDTGPVVIAEDGRNHDVGDGYHRIGIAFTRGIATIPAIVGRRTRRSTRGRNGGRTVLKSSP